MKIEELRSLSAEELSKKFQEAQKELFNLKMKLVTKQLVNHREVPRVKRRIAQIKTILREKQLLVAKG